MSVLDKVIAAVTPPESDDARAEARRKAQNAAATCDWLRLVLDHHLQIEGAVAEIEQSSSAEGRRKAQKSLALVLTGHSLAEEVVLYPALALNGEKAHSGMGYTEQSAVKVQMAALEELDPMSQDYLDKIGHIKGALQHHMYEEEGSWFPDLIEKTGSGEQLAARYRKEYDRYTGVMS